MFRAQTNPMDDVVAKATDENLTSENWEFMMDAWEKVNTAGENGPKDAVAALIKRLAHRNANVQIYTLELANAFSQNCGAKMHAELASRAFTDQLLRLVGDRNTHATVKSKCLEKMAEWTEMFKNDPGLGIMEQAYSRVKSANPNIHPPSKPTKREITDADRQKEEEELQMALAISLKEKSTPSQAYKPAQASTSSSSSAQPVQQAITPPAPAPHTTAATVSRVRALYDFVPSESGELAFRKGDIIAVLESVYKDWWKGSLRGQTGIFPLNYVEKLADPTAEELQRDAQMEAEVFGQIKNVEKLLALLSTSDGNPSTQDNEEITTLYHSTLQIRPKLIELIGRYSQKKDDFVALNEKFIKARRDYEALLESSMSQTAAAHYGRPPAAALPYTYPPADTYADPSRYYNAGPVGGPGGRPGASAPHGGPHGRHSTSPQPQSAYPAPSRTPANQYYNQGPPGHDDPVFPTAGAAPFYVIGQMPPHGGRTSAGPQHNLQPSAPPLGHGPGQGQGPAQGQAQVPGQEAQPQELATSVYDTPTESRHDASFAGPGGQTMPGGYPSQPQGYYSQHPTHPGTSGTPGIPGHPGHPGQLQHPGHPAHSADPSPVTPQAPYAAGQYAAYPGQKSYLPNGSRAQS
ncbi:hypothetical protein BZA77DRAFT_322407 [Pyronema omphalodes]|nr:hypothetical protein BZA77DRAFT_322407 [Pyronema omphalodes]